MKSKRTTSSAELNNDRVGLSRNTQTTHQDDRELCRAVARNDHLAAANFFDRFQKDVNKIVWHILGADPDHDDLVQQAFLQMLRALSRGDRIENPGAWVRTVTVNTVRTELRRRARRRARQKEFDRLIVSEETSTDYRARRLLQRCYAILDRLEENERIAFVLRHMEGYTLQETADACQCSLATIKRRLAKAHDTFRDLAGQDALLAEFVTREEP